MQEKGQRQKTNTEEEKRKEEKRSTLETDLDLGI